MTRFEYHWRSNFSGSDSCLSGHGYSDWLVGVISEQTKPATCM